MTRAQEDNFCAANRKGTNDILNTDLSWSVYEIEKLCQAQNAFWENMNAKNAYHYFRVKSICEKTH